MNTVWILVCDAARGRLFETRGNDASWKLLDVFTHGESRSQAADVTKEVEKFHFGHTLATMLDQAMRSQRFDRLVLVSPPHFLGMLKKELTPELEKHLMISVDKDLTHIDAAELVERLRDTVRVPAQQHAD